jgi:arylsulfatase A-like enzyme
MSKKLKILLSGFFILIFLLHTKAQKKNDKLPNIIFILADDLGYGDIGSYGQKIIRTPNIDKIAEEGMRFTSFYAGSTVCAPSRASLMTGQHTGSTYIRGNGELALRAQDSIIPQFLKQKGYVNGLFGKWGLGLENTTGVPENKGWDHFLGHLHHVEGHFQQADSLWKLVNGKSKRISIPKESYVNEMFTSEAIEFINQNQENPFFLFVSYTVPHAELRVPRGYMQLYQDENGNSALAPEKPHPAGQHYRQQSQPRAAYAAMVSSMDDYIGRIMIQLKKNGLDENTIVIFSSDNGTHTEGGRRMEDVTELFQSSGPLRGSKRDLYEGGIRIPFIVRWPGRIKPGSISDQPGAFWDVLPTLADITGARFSSSDGISFLPTMLRRKQVKEHQFLYWEFYEGGFKQAVRKGKWKAIRFYKRNGEVMRTELYDLKADIGEKNDLSGKYPDITKELEALMGKAHKPSESPLFRIN